MIKLKTILKEMEDPKINGTLNYYFNVNHNILAFCSADDDLEIDVDVYFTGTISEPEILRYKTTWLVLNKTTQIPYSRLHPKQKKIIDYLVDSEFEHNEEEIKQQIIKQER